MKKILITIGSYFPGYKIGGPAVTIKNLINMFESRKDLKFYIFCPNHDWDEKKIYDSVESDRWIQHSNFDIFYASKKCFNTKYFKKIIDDFDIIYCTGAFTSFALAAANYAKKNKNKKVIIAPMGSFFDNVIKIKRFKKTVFFLYTKLFNIFKKCFWSVTSVEEKEATEKIYGKRTRIVVAQDPVAFSDAILVQKESKDNYLHVVHLSRIHESKGLHLCIEILKKCKSNVVFDVYGTIEDISFYNKCVEKATELPSNIIFTYKGSYLPTDSTRIFSCYDVFLFPTCSENFGHVIFESLKSSCVPLISDKTPWSDIEKHASGFVFSLTDINSFTSKIEEISSLSLKDLNKIKENCYNFAKQKYEESTHKSGYEVLFE